MSRRCVAIAGERGVVSQRLQAELAKHPDLQVSVISTAQSSEPAGLRVLNAADICVLAVQDFASPQILEKLGAETPVLDISPAFRTHPDWVYGLPELPGQAQRIASAQKVANPGCFATAAILAVAPLVQAGLLAADAALYLDGVGGYSTGGARMEAQADAGTLKTEAAFSLTRPHRHLDEIRHFTGLTGPVWFTPKIAAFRQGIRMQLPVAAPREAVLEALQGAYAGTAVLVDSGLPSSLPADEWAGRPGACLRVFPHAGGSLVVSSLDNLGKGAVDAAVDNLLLMLSGR